MREIKFRAWDNTKNIWYTEWENPNRSEWTPDDGHKEYSITSSDESITLEQFTGLRDKNGKEIYEGDIVESEYAPGMEDGVSAVIWHKNEACFYIENDDLNIYDPIYNITGHCTVIGNIHENMDLLK